MTESRLIAGGNVTSYSVDFPDNDSHMCGSDDRLLKGITGVPVCPSCHFKTDPYFINSAFRVKRALYDLSSTYDGYVIASLKFREACRRLHIEGADFLTLPADRRFFVVKPTSVVAFDVEARRVKFTKYCETCGLYGATAGATPAFLRAESTTGLSRADIFFGSGNSRGPLLIASRDAKEALSKERLAGLRFLECRVP